MPSKCFGPTDSVSDTLTQIGSNYQMLNGDWVIDTIRIGKGNVVNAKECSGHVHVVTTERTYDLAYGNGSGGATNNGQNGPAEVIDSLFIHCPGGQNIAVYVLDSQVAKNVTVSLHFRPGGSNNYRTLAAGGISANADTAAATEESFTVNTKLTGATLQPAIDGYIRRIRFAGSGVVDAKAGSGKLTIVVPNNPGPWEFAIGNGPGGATLGGPQWADSIDIPEGIKVQNGMTIDVKILTAEIMKTPTVSLEYW